MVKLWWQWKPGLPWCDDAIIWSSNQNKLLDAQEVSPPCWGGEMEKFMTFLPFHNAHFYCTSMNIEDLMDSDSQSFYYLSCCCEVCHHQALPGSCCPAGSVTSGEGLWKKHICFCTVALKVKTQQHFLGGCFLLFQIIEHLLCSFLPFQ